MLEYVQVHLNKFEHISNIFKSIQIHLNEFKYVLKYILIYLSTLKDNKI